MSERPFLCESWCAGNATPDLCTCDLEERQARWDRENRAPSAAELPRATVVQTKREQNA